VTGADRFAAALVELFGELDWRALGEHYCHEGGDGFFDAQARENLLDAELGFASDVAEALAPPTKSASAGTGRSLYVGAAVSELGPILCETLVLGRRVAAFSLDNAETRELNRALDAVAGRLGHELFRIDTTEVTSVAPPCDHLWIVSVLNDPESFPALHDELYERGGTELAVGGGNRAAELAGARRLLDHVLGALVTPARVTCSDEELPLVREAAAATGLVLDQGSRARLSPVVGDPVRSWRADRRPITSCPPPAS
jgi:hypothetical protein